MDFIKNSEPIMICDIGAAPSDKTDFIDDLFTNTNSKLVGFEPNPDEFRKLKNVNNKKFYNFAIGDGEEKTLNICSHPAMSSFLKPDLEYLKLFGFAEISQIVSTINISSKKLNDIEDNFDLIKIDAQGYESEIIRCGEEKIKKSLVLQLETSPTPLYKDEKSSAQILKKLEELGFALHMFNKVKTQCFRPMVLSNNPDIGLNYLFQLDCVLVRNFREIKKLSSEQLRKLILIMFYSFKSYDFVDFLIVRLDELENSKFINDYRDLLKLLKFNKIY